MATDPISGLQAELEAALSVLDPQIRGVQDVERHPITDLLRSALATAEAAMTQRRGLMQRVLDDIARLSVPPLIQRLRELLGDMDALQTNGYPVPLTFDISAPLLVELNNEAAEVQAGAGVFEAIALATGFAVTFGEPRPKIIQE